MALRPAAASSSASRAGRNAEPTSWVCFTWISRSMMSPRAISRRWTCSSMVSISLRSTSSEGGAGGDLDIFKTLKEARPSRPADEAH